MRKHLTLREDGVTCEQQTFLTITAEMGSTKPYRRGYIRPLANARSLFYPFFDNPFLDNSAMKVSVATSTAMIVSAARNPWPSPS